MAAADAPPVPTKPVPIGYAGAMMASDMAVSDDRTSTTLTFASDRMEPVSWSKATGLAPIAVEVSGCTAANPAAVPGGSGMTRLFDAASQLYLLSARVPKKEKAEAKDKAADVSLIASTANLLLDKNSLASTTVTVDLGEKPKSGFALTVVGAVIKAALPAATVSRRTDGSYLVKSSGPVDLTFSNLVVNQAVDLELRTIDEKDKLGAATRKLTFTARSSKS